MNLLPSGGPSSPATTVDALEPRDSIDPDATWLNIEKSQVFSDVHPHIRLVPAPFTAPKPPNSMRFVVVSDTHHLYNDPKRVPDGDVFLHAGDFSNTGEAKDIEDFSKFLAGLPHQHKIVIAGNHDLSFDKTTYGPDMAKRFRHAQVYNSDALIAMVKKHSTYLLDEETKVGPFRIYGSPWQPEFFDWGFNLARGAPCADVWAKIPSGIDILITHGPPLGRGDRCQPGNRAGCVDLLKEVQTRVKPKAHIFGHIHEGYGVTSDGVTSYINASTCTLRYKPTNPPIVFDLPFPQ